MRQPTTTEMLLSIRVWLAVIAIEIAHIRYGWNEWMLALCCYIVFEFAFRSLPDRLKW